MKYKDQRELVEGLRKLADFIEEHPELPISDPEISVEYWIHEPYTFDDDQRSVKERMQVAARALGRANKEYYGSYFNLSRKFSEHVKLEFTSDRQEVCRRVVKEVVHHPEQIVPQKVLPARTEEVVEWVCDDPILAG
jgi:hypothetical protein